MESLFVAISDELDILSSPISPGEKLASSLMNEAFAAIEAKVNQIRGRGVRPSAPAKSDRCRGELTVLRSLLDELNNLRTPLNISARFLCDPA
jgi:hypothetical protein